MAQNGSERSRPGEHPSAGRAPRPLAPGFGRALLVLGAAGVLLALATRLVPARSAAAQSAVVIRETHYDFGVVAQNAPLQHRFLLSNPGPRAFDILNVAACCSVSASLEGAPHVAPGDSRTVLVRTSAPYALGPMERTAEVETSDSVLPHITLHLSWLVAAPVSAVPDQVDFGDVSAGKRPQRTVRFVYPPKGFDLLACRCTSPALLARVIRVDQNALYRQVFIQMCPELAPPSGFAGTVFVRTNQPGRPELAIRVRASVQGELEAQPARLYLGFIGLRPGASAATVVRSRARLSTPLQPVRGVGDRFAVTLRRRPDGLTYDLTATTRRPLPGGRVEDAIELRAGPRRLRIPITGYVYAAPR